MIKTSNAFNTAESIQIGFYSVPISNSESIILRHKGSLGITQAPF